MQKIHFKVAVCHNETVFRRFALDSNANHALTFNTLKSELISLFKIENFIAQYKDDEAQWVTFSTDEELAFAAKLMGNRLNLQLLVSNTAQHHEPGNENRACGSDNVREQPPAKHVEKQEKQAAKNARLEQQRDQINEKIRALKASDNPKVAAQVEKLQQKLDAISAKLPEKPKIDEKPAPAPKLNKKVSVPEQQPQQPLNGNDRLVQHRDRIVEKISTLQASQNPKAQAQVEQLQQKLVAVNAKLDQWIQAQKDREAVKQANIEKRNAQKDALLKKRDDICEKISALKLRSVGNPKLQPQLDKLEEHLKVINAKLQKFQPASEEIPTKPAENSSSNSSAAIVPVDDTKTALVEAKAKHKVLHHELQEYKANIGSMAKFLRLLRKNPSKADDEMIRQTENFLGLLQQAFSEKKTNFSSQAGVMKMLMKTQAKKQAEINKKNKKGEDNKNKKKCPKKDAGAI